ncbi:MAG: hypothetical protein FWF44_08525 [Defluviitaleaceae bacterium]|nr:hypothetical protein [Defluviitaleaceae bacterium]
MQKDSVILDNGVLRAEIAMPYALYNGPRFENCGIIRQVTLNGGAAFCASEKEGSEYRGGGIGLCCEFGIDNALDYNEANPGEWVVKIGVGRIKKEDGQPFFHERPFEFERLDIACAEGENAVAFSASQPELRGYAYEYAKRISINNNSLKIDYALKNTGERDIVTNEYCHNFTRFNDVNIGKGYVLEVLDAEWDFSPDSPKPGTLAFGREPERTYYKRDSEPKNIWGWRLTHNGLGLRMSERLSADACRFALWGTNRVISPELFMGISLKPGEGQEWSREYAFEEGVL